MAFDRQHFLTRLAPTFTNAAPRKTIPRKSRLLNALAPESPQAKWGQAPRMYPLRAPPFPSNTAQLPVFIPSCRGCGAP